MTQKGDSITLTLYLSTVRAIPQPSAPQALSPPERSEYNLPPSGGHNLRPGGPSTFPFTTILHNPRRQPRPFFIKLRRSRHHNPRPEGPSNLRTLRPIGPVHLKNPPSLRTLTPQVCPMNPRAHQLFRNCPISFTGRV